MLLITFIRAILCCYGSYSAIRHDADAAILFDAAAADYAFDAADTLRLFIFDTLRLLLMPFAAAYACFSPLCYLMLSAIIAIAYFAAICHT